MDTTIYQCACAGCGHVIEYRANQAGLIVNCPKCREKSRLPTPAKPPEPGPFDSPPDIPEFKECPVCKTRLNITAKSCTACDNAARLKSRNQLYVIIGISSAVALCVLAFGAFFLLRYFRRPPVPAPVAHIYIETAQRRGPKSIKDLSPGKFVLEKRRGSDLFIGVGDIQNISEYTHLDIKLDLDVLDKNGAKIGTVSDYCTVLAPHGVWHAIATVEQPNAMSVRFANLSEAK